MITIACVWVQGHVPFSAQYVEKLHRMAWRWAKEPFEFVCLTDQPEKLSPTIRTIKIKLPKGMKGWWAKVELFNPAHELKGRILSLDLDTLIVAPLTPIINYPARFALAPDGAPNFKGGGGLKVVKRFNSSVMLFTAGEQSDIYTQFNKAVTKRLWGDQDWIGELYPKAVAMPKEWFPRISEGSPPEWKKGTKVVLCKKPKNELAAKQWPWFKEMWG